MYANQSLRQHRIYCRAQHLLVIIFVLLWPFASLAGLIAEKTNIAIGEPLSIQLQTEDARNVRWAAGPELRILSSNDKGARVEGILAGNARLQALWLGGKERITITVNATQWWDKSNPKLQRLSYDQQQMVDLLRKANQALAENKTPADVAQQFYADLAGLGLKEPMVELNRLKTRLLETGLADAVLGERFPNAAGTPVERALLVYRRDLTLESIRDAVADVARRFGSDTGSVFLAKIGKWAVQSPEMLTLAGDIDFSFLGARSEVILALRDAYAQQIKQRTGGLDMVAIDSLATAHGFAKHHVYIGIQGRKFGDDTMASMTEGVERINFDAPDALSTSRASPISGELALWETVLEEAGLLYRDQGHEESNRVRLEDLDRAWRDRRNQTVEPFLSMEMARHLDKDIIQNIDVFTAIDIIKKGAKYLRRSNNQSQSDLGIQPADAALARFVMDVDEMARTAEADDLVKFIDTGLKNLGFTGFEMRFDAKGNATLVADPDGPTDFLARTKQMIWSNVSSGMDMRIRALTDAINNRGQAAGPGTPDDLRPERLADTLHMLAEGLKVMKAEQSHIPPDIVTKASVLTRLVESYGGQRSYALPAGEIEKIRQLLQEAAANDTTLLLAMGTVANHIDQWLVKNYDRLSARLPAARQLSSVDARIDSLNSLLDVLDDTLLNTLRAKGVLELDLGQGPDGKPRIYAATFPRIAAINQRLNESVLARVGNNTAFKAFNLAQEGDAYYSAIIQANTPSEAFSNVATEIFRRRMPGGGVLEAWVMENYARMGIEVVYTIFPPLAIPEGLYGMGAALYESGRQAWWHSTLETLIDGLYEQAEFGKDSEGSGHYPLTHVTYKGVRYSRRELEAGKRFILDPDVDTALTENLRAGDPFLSLMAELENHPSAGEKVRAHFRAQADQRWIELKREFVRHLIERLENRHAAEVSDLTGQLPGIYAELMEITSQLNIRDQVIEHMDAEWDSNNLQAFWIWLKNVARQAAWGGTLSETERNKAAAIVRRYRDAYRSVLSARQQLEGEITRLLADNGLPDQSLTQHRQRLLTGIVFLTGVAERDQERARQWAGMAGLIQRRVAGELSGIKSRYVSGSRIDTDFDRRALGQIVFEDIWIEALRDMRVPVISAAGFKRAAEARKQKRAELIETFEEHYAKLAETGEGQDKPTTAGSDDQHSNGTEPIKVDTVASPSCSYTYSDWGDCNRATKTQTRTVTARAPAGCEERRTPTLEQSCTPPPTEEELRHKYLNCLCHCSSGWNPHIGVWYDPEGKYTPECESSGPCFGGAGAFGCTRRHFFGGQSDCSQGCWERYFGKDSYDPDKAEAMRKAENSKYKKPLSVQIEASKNPADFGDVVKLTAETSDGTGGYRWTWGGCAQEAKDKRAQVFHTHKCEPCTASVTVTDQDGDSASDTLLVECTTLSVKLTKESPTDNTIPVGDRVKLLAEVFSGDQPAAGRFTYYWEPNPDVQYGSDPKNPRYETSGGAQSRNTALLRRPGATLVWVTALKQIGKTKVVVGESEQILIDVISPQLSLKADKPNPLIGEPVVLTVEETPKMSDDLVSFWWEYSGAVNSPGTPPNTPNRRSWWYKPKNDQPVTATVHAKSKDSGEELGKASLTLTARPIQVSVSGPKIAGPAPMVWKEGVGLVAAERQVATHQRVEFAATLNPSVDNPRYRWRIEPSGCSIHSPSSRETGVTCSSAGNYSLSVTVKNADGAELGIGAGQLSVSGSQAPSGSSGDMQYHYSPNAAISGYNTRHLTDVSVQDCMNACNRETWCKSFDYYKKQQKCDLSNKSAVDVGGLKRNYPGNPYDHYARISTSPSAPTESKADPAASKISQGATMDGQSSGFVGEWKTEWGPLRLEKASDSRHGIIGSYTHDKGRISGRLSEDGSRLTGTWSEAPSYAPPRDAGRFEFVLDEDQDSFTGTWGYGEEDMTGNWAGTRIQE